MWVTIVRDHFGSGERPDIRAALEEIASPLDTWGWSSNAVYTFWDPQSREVLYVRLAVDIAERFAQHLGYTPETRRVGHAAFVGWYTADGLRAAQQLALQAFPLK